MTHIRFTSVAPAVFGDIISEVSGKLLSVRRPSTAQEKLDEVVPAAKGFNIGDEVLVGTHAEVMAGTADITQQVADGLKAMEHNGQPVAEDM